MKKGLEDTITYFNKAISKDKIYLVDPEYYSSDQWYDDQEKRKFLKNKKNRTPCVRFSLFFTDFRQKIHRKTHTGHIKF